jgi:AraC-like DNA-binding protein
LGFSDPTAAVAQNRQAASPIAGLWGSVEPFPKAAAIDPRISHVTALIHRSVQRKLTLGELAGETGLSVSRLCHLFKNHHGMGPAHYLKLLRLQRGKELLETSVFSVKEISARLGYDDPSRFVEDFRKMHGLTPLRHRRLGPTGGVSTSHNRRATADHEPTGNGRTQQDWHMNSKKRIRIVLAAREFRGTRKPVC